VLDPRAVEGVVAGVAAGCRENGCALLGGETAEMPGVYTPPDYDLAGFIVGYVDEDAILGPQRVREGDVIVGIESSGLHTNGFSLARRIVNERMQLSVDDQFPGGEASVGDVMLTVHRSYLSVLRPVLSHVHAMAHITGGGIPGNLNRALPPTLDAIVDTSSWHVPNLFEQLQRAGGVDRHEMFRTFNMGVGMTVITPEPGAGDVMSAAAAQGLHAWKLGVVRRGSGQVVLT
jgi:phosphoribosylaminoimidazole synthetase